MMPAMKTLVTIAIFYREVTEDFTAKIPLIKFKSGTGLDCELVK